MMEKTHAMRVLEARGIAYEAVSYDLDAEFHSAAEAAELLGVDASTVYKTLVVLREGTTRARPILIMAPATEELDIKLLARELHVKKVRMATFREAEVLTGMQPGAISALSLRKPERFEIFIDESARALEYVHVSAGVRGIDLALRTADLVTVTDARFVRACH
jgi:Cys-tRNA(Pro)/Cys-tRNA(Cys) deacylase